MSTKWNLLVSVRKLLVHQGTIKDSQPILCWTSDHECNNLTMWSQSSHLCTPLRTVLSPAPRLWRSDTPSWCSETHMNSTTHWGDDEDGEAHYKSSSVEPVLTTLSLRRSSSVTEQDRSSFNKLFLSKRVKMLKNILFHSCLEVFRLIKNIWISIFVV